MPKKTSLAVRKQIKRLRFENLSYAKIVELTGVSWTTVYYYARNVVPLKQYMTLTEIVTQLERQMSDISVLLHRIGEYQGSFISKKEGEDEET